MIKQCPDRSRYDFSLDDIAIAQSALEDSKLLTIVAGKPLICEIYCIPSHNHQAFYLQIYGGEQFTLVYAKSYIADHRGFDIAMYPFQDVLQAESHPAYRGDIYCGIKHLPATDSFMNTVISCLPKHEEIAIENVIIIDGVMTIVRNCTVSPPVTIGYKTYDNLTRNVLPKEQTVFMDNLYLSVEGIIGNVLDHKCVRGLWERHIGY